MQRELQRSGDPLGTATEWTDMSKYRKSARGQECQVRLSFVCNGNPETTVLAHLPGGGMGRKTADTEASFCCSACHDVLDGRATVPHYDHGELRMEHLEGAVRTRAIWREMGWID